MAVAVLAQSGCGRQPACDGWAMLVRVETQPVPQSPGRRQPDPASPPRSGHTASSPVDPTHRAPDHENASSAHPWPAYAHMGGPHETPPTRPADSTHNLRQPATHEHVNVLLTFLARACISVRMVAQSSAIGPPPVIFDPASSAHPAIERDQPKPARSVPVRAATSPKTHDRERREWTTLAYFDGQARSREVT